MVVGARRAPGPGATAPRPASTADTDTLGIMSEPRSDAPPESPRALPDGRYGDAESNSGLASKAVAVVLGLLVVAIVVASGFTIYRLNATPEVTGEVVGVDVVDDDKVNVSFTVTRDEPGTPVYCIIRAQEQSKGELGRREVYVQPSESDSVRIDTTIATSARAFMADVYGCGSDVPDYLRR